MCPEFDASMLYHTQEGPRPEGRFGCSPVAKIQCTYCIVATRLSFILIYNPNYYFFVELMMKGAIPLSKFCPRVFKFYSRTSKFNCASEFYITRARVSNSRASLKHLPEFYIWSVMRIMLRGLEILFCL